MKTAVVSFLYYQGLLTLTDDPGLLRIPNLVVRKLFLDGLLEAYLPRLSDNSEARESPSTFSAAATSPTWPTFSKNASCRRDRGAPPRSGAAGGGGVNEMVLKALVLAILFEVIRSSPSWSSNKVTPTC